MKHSDWRTVIKLRLYNGNASKMRGEVEFVIKSDFLYFLTFTVC